MRCNCCDRVLGDAEIQLAPDNKTFEPCSTCMEIIMDTAYSDGFTRPVDEEFDIDDDGELELDLGPEEVENLEDDDDYRSYFDHCDITQLPHDPDGSRYE